MKKHRSVLWFILWGVFIVIGLAFSGVSEVLYYFKNGVHFVYPPYADYQIFLLLFYAPFILVPMLGASCYYATMEKIKWIKIVSIVMIIQHIFCIVAFLIEMLLT